MSAEPPSTSSSPLPDGGAPRKVTIQDVARMCNLAPSTVSNALADKAIVRPETKLLVRRVAAELGYTASPLARGLRTGRTWAIGLIVSDITNPFHGELVRGAEDILSRSGFNLNLANSDQDEARQHQHVQHFVERQVDGVILMSCAPDSRDVEQLRRAGIPTILLMRRSPDGGDHGLDYCGVENTRGMNSALKHLRQLGHQRIGFINGPSGSSTAAERLAEYRRFMTAETGSVDEALIDSGEYSIEAGRLAAARMLRGAEPPTAIMAGEDLIAVGVMITANELGIRVPQDLSVVGWDDLFVAGIPQINLTTMRVPKWELGVNAARLLQRRLESPAAEAETLLVRPELVVRGTTGLCRLG